MMTLGQATTRRRPDSPRGGFTLIEVMVSVIILSILAGLIAVRLQSDIRRRRDLMGVRVQAVLEILAFRQQMSQDRIALAWDGGSRTLRLERLYQAEDEDEATWKRDLMAPAVVFDDPEIQITQIRFDGELVDLFSLVHWEMPVAAIRPTIELEMSWGEEIDLIQLLPHEIKAARYGFGLALPMAEGLGPIDLDEAGKAEDSW